MPVNSLEFLIGVFFVAAVFPLARAAWLRRFLLASSTAIFLSTHVPNSSTWLALAAFLFSGYGMAVLVRRRPSPALVALYLFGLVAVFLYLQRYDFLALFLPDSLLRHPIGIVGLSYMLFRQIHFIVDTLQGQIPRATLWEYLNYQLNLFGLIAGPIQRHQEFSKYWAEPIGCFPDRHEVLKTYARIFLGVLKLSGLSALFLFAYEEFSKRLLDIHSGNHHPGRWSAMLQFGVTFYAYPAYVYFNFSGYCDIVIGCARLIGLKMPENFDRPYLARNMIDYWNRWHKSLSFWIRDYVFTPLYKTVAHRWPRRSLSLAIPCYFIALFLAGVWHGSTWNWVVFGLLNGLGVSAAKLWENHLVNQRGRAGLKRYLQSTGIRSIAVFCNLNFACVTILFFPSDLDQSLNILAGFYRGVTQ